VNTTDGTPGWLPAQNSQTRREKKALDEGGARQALLERSSDHYEMLLGRFVEAAIRGTGTSKVALANHAGVSRQSLYNLIDGTHTPSLPNIVSVLSALGMRVAPAQTRDVNADLVVAVADQDWFLFLGSYEQRATGRAQLTKAAVVGRALGDDFRPWESVKRASAIGRAIREAGSTTANTSARHEPAPATSSRTQLEAEVVKALDSLSTAELAQLLDALKAMRNDAVDGGAGNA
jgi:DNA-binding phage protein